MGVRVLPRRARGGDRADTGLVELGRVDVVALVLFDKGRGSVVFGLGGGGRGVGLCGFVVEEREEKRRSGREEEEIRQGGKKTSPPMLSLFSLLLSHLFLGLFLGGLDGLEPALELAVCRERGRNTKGRERLGGERRKRKRDRAFKRSSSRLRVCSLEEASRLQIALCSQFRSCSLWSSATSGDA